MRVGAAAQEKLSFLNEDDPLFSEQNFCPLARTSALVCFSLFIMTNAINTWNLKHRHSSFSLSLPRAISGRPTVLGLRGDLASSKPRFGAQANGLVLEYGCASLQGTSRKQNEDRFTVDVCDELMTFA